MHWDWKKRFEKQPSENGRKKIIPSRTLGASQILATPIASQAQLFRFAISFILPLPWSILLSWPFWQFVSALAQLLTAFCGAYLCCKSLKKRFKLTMSWRIFLSPPASPFARLSAPLCSVLVKCNWRAEVCTRSPWRSSQVCVRAVCDFQFFVLSAFPSDAGFLLSFRLNTMDLSQLVLLPNPSRFCSIPDLLIFGYEACKSAFFFFSSFRNCPLFLGFHCNALRS